MSRTMIRAAALLVALFAAASLSAFDWGVTIDNSSTLEIGEWTDNDTEVQRDKVSLWAEHFWTGSGDARYRVLGNVYYLFTDERAFLVDADLLKFEMIRPNTAGGAVMDLSLGRFRFSDSTGVVLNHGADGALLGLDYSAVRISAGAGYTGLQLKPESNVDMSAADLADGEDDDIHFAPKRLFEVLTIGFPEFLPRQRFAVEASLQQGLRTEYTLDSAHVIARLDGALGGGFYYDLSGAAAMNLSDDVQDVMAGGTLRWFAESFYGSRASAGFLLAGEDFFAISEPTLGLVFNPDPADILRVSVDYSLRPWAGRLSPALRNLQFAAGAKFFMLPDGTYGGTELEGGINFRPSHDFGASVKAGAWMPDEGDFQGLVRFDVSIGL